jgi:uncharacterized membrane protein
VVSSSNDIRERARDWVGAGIIDDAQAARIASFEAERDAAAVVDEPVSARSRMQAVFGVFGGLLVGLGILLTVATNWNEISDPSKVAIIVATMLAAYALALLADARSAARWPGTVAYVVGIGMFAAGLPIIGNVYNVDAHPPIAALLVAAAATALTLLAERATLGWIASAAWLGWGILEIADSLGDIDDERAAIQLIAAIVLLGVAGTAASFGAEAFRQTALLALPLRVLSLLLSMVVLVQAGLAWHWEIDWSVRGVRPALIVPLAAALVAIGLFSRVARLQHRRAFVAGLFGVAMIVVVTAVLQQDLFAAIAASVVLALGGIGLILSGMVESRSELFVIGIAWLVFLTLSRYLDFVFSVELGGLGFIGAGVLLLVLAWLAGSSRRLWRRRGEVLS